MFPLTPKIKKKAGLLDSAVKQIAGPGLKGVGRALFSPGEFVHNVGGNGQNNVLGSLALAGVGAGAGAAYHHGRRALYNTPEENAEEDESGHKTLMKRMLVPGIGAGVLGGVQSSLFDTRYKDLAAGVPSV
jgi:hypothetical protein